MNKFFYFILFFPLIIFSQDWNQIGEDIDGLAAGDWTGTAVSTNNSGDIIAIGENHSTYYNGRVRVFQKSSYNSWIQIGQSLYGDGQGGSVWSTNSEDQGEKFGYNISLNSDGTILAISAPRHDIMLGSVVLGQEAGLVKVYQLIDDLWVQMGNTINGEEELEATGFNGLELNNSGNILAISSVNGVKVYEFLQDSWTLLGGELIQSTTDYNPGTSFQNASISINGSGNKLSVVNFYCRNAYIFEFIDNSWQEIASFQLSLGPYLQNTKISINDNGNVVAFSFRTSAAIGNTTVRAYKYINQTWGYSQIGEDIIGDYGFGRSISIDNEGNRIAVGTFGGNSAPVSSYSDGFLNVYEYSGTDSNQWDQIGSTILSEDTMDAWGYCVAISGDGNTIIGGGPLNEANGSFASDTNNYIVNFDGGSNIPGMDPGHVRVYSYFIDPCEDIDISPPTGEANQNFCNEATIDDLVVSGENINWYDSISNGVLLTSDYVLNDGETLYATQTIDGCESSEKLAVTTNYVTPSNITGLSSQSFCFGATIEDLVVEGNNIVWFDSMQGGNQLPNSYVLTNGQIAYASEVLIDCESDDRLEVNIEISNCCQGDNNEWVQVGDVIDGESLAYNFFGGSTAAINQEGNIVASVHKGSDLNGIVQVFQNIDNVWTQLGEDINNPNLDFNCVGSSGQRSLAMNASGTIIVVGSCNPISQFSQRGLVVYEYIDEQWLVKGEIISQQALNSNSFAFNSVSISDDGNTIAAKTGLDGAQNFMSAGKVKTWKFLNNQWTELEVDFNTVSTNNNNEIVGRSSAPYSGGFNHNAFDGYSGAFGNSISLSGDGLSLAISGFGGWQTSQTNWSRSRVSIFKLIDGKWAYKGEPIAAPYDDIEYNGSGFGTDVALSYNGNKIVFSDSWDGTPPSQFDAPGSVRVYAYYNEADDWAMVGEKIMGEPGDRLGPVSINNDGNIIAVGVLDAYSSAPIRPVRVYQKINNTWVKIGEDLNGGSNIGNTVGLSGDGTTIVIGTPNNSENCQDCEISTGHMRVLSLNNNIISSPEGESTQSFCNEATIDDLVAEGDNIQWYDAATGGNLISNTDALTNGQIVYATQTVNGCESLDTLKINVEVINCLTTTSCSDNNEWAQVGDVIDGDNVAGNWFGTTSVINQEGDIVASLQNGIDLNGSVKVFQNIDNDWTQLGEDINNPNLDFGCTNYASTSRNSLALNASGTVIAIASCNPISQFSQRGLVVYEYIDEQWLIKGEIIYQSTSNSSAYGYNSVTISDDGNTIAAKTGLDGAQNAISAGKVKTWKFLNNQWTELEVDYNSISTNTYNEIVGRSYAPYTGGFDHNGYNAWSGANYAAYSGAFGNVVSLSGDGLTLAVGNGSWQGSQTQYGRSRVSIYKFINGEWTHKGEPITQEYFNGDSYGSGFGWDIDLNYNGNSIVLSDINDDGISEENTGVAKGSVSVYKYYDYTDKWSIIGEKILGENTGDHLGTSVSINDDGNIIAMSAQAPIVTINGSLYAKIYQKVNNEWTQIGEDISTGSYYNYNSLALSGDGTTVVIGSAQSSENCQDCEDQIGYLKIMSFNNTSSIQAPNGESTQSFCNEATIDDLVAEGDNIQWYDAATGGNLLSNTDALTNGQIVYATQVVGECESSQSLAVTVNLTSPEVVTGESTQSFCNEATIDDLVAEGDNIQWYDAATGGNLLSNTDALTNGQIVYATQVVGECESSQSLAVTVNLTSPEVVTGESTQSFCNEATIDDLVAEGDNIQWYDAATGGNLLSNTDALTNGQIVYATQVVGECESSQSLAVTVNLTSPEVVTGESTQSFCNEATIDDLVAEGDNIQWYDAATGGNLLSNTDALTNGQIVYATQVVGECESSQSLAVTVNLTSPEVVTGESTQSFCNEATIDDLVAEGDNIQWYDAATGGNLLSNTDALTNGQIVYATQVVGECESSQSLAVTVNLTSPEVVTGESTQSFCNEATIDDLVAEGDNIQWYDAATGGNLLSNTDALTNGQIVYATQVVGECESSQSLAVTVNLTSPEVVTGESTQSFCNEATIDDLVAEGDNIQWYDAATGGNLLSNTDALTNGQIVYATQVVGECESSQSLAVTVNLTSPEVVTGESTQSFCNEATIDDLVAEGDNIQWYDAATGGNLLSNTDALTNGQIVYATQVVGECESSQSLAVTVNLTSPEVVTGESTQSFCNEATIDDLVAEGDNIQWYDAATGGNLLSNTDALTNGQIVYATQVVGECESSQSLAVTVEISSIEDPSSELLNQNFCLESDATISDIIIDNSSNQILWYDQPIGGNQLTIDDLLENNTIYYAAIYNFESGCESFNRLPITVNINPCEVNIYNAISINNNYENNYMVIENAEYYPDNKLDVYNRNGKLIYRQNGYASDGTKLFYGKGNYGVFLNSNDYLPTGTYMYVFSYYNNYTNEAIVKRGFLTINNSL